MRPRLRQLLAAAALTLTLAFAAPASAELIDRIMAVVGGQPIMLSDVQAAIEFQLVQPPPGTADPAGYVMDRLIERRLMLAEVDRFAPPEPDPIEITAREDAIERRAGSNAAFERRLAVAGITREQLRRHIRDDLRTTTYLNQRFGATAQPSDRSAATAAWLAELRRRADITVLYAPRPQSAPNPPPRRAAARRR